LSQEKDDIIIGIDPGTQITGFGLIQVKNGQLAALDFGCIRPPALMPLSDRYLIIFNGIEQLLEKYRPTTLVVETQYVSKNPQSAIKLGMARGVVIVAAKRKGLHVVEYAPTQAKQAVLGNGRASKQQVQWMVQKLLNLSVLPKPEDASDALALAICHVQARRFKRFLGKDL
jgi:crossover junction endodeoxyribonuclease RuvC